MFGASIVLGVNDAFETISAQAKGAGNFKLVGVYLNRARLINLCLFVPVCIFLTQTASILVLIGQNEQIAAIS